MLVTLVKLNLKISKTDPCLINTKRVKMIKQLHLLGFNNKTHHNIQTSIDVREQIPHFHKWELIICTSINLAKNLLKVLIRVKSSCLIHTFKENIYIKAAKQKIRQTLTLRLIIFLSSQTYVQWNQHKFHHQFHLWPIKILSILVYNILQPIKIRRHSLKKTTPKYNLSKIISNKLSSFCHQIK